MNLRCTLLNSKISAYEGCILCDFYCIALYKDNAIDWNLPVVFRSLRETESRCESQMNFKGGEIVVEGVVMENYRELFLFKTKDFYSIKYKK